MALAITLGLPFTFAKSIRGTLQSLLSPFFSVTYSLRETCTQPLAPFFPQMIIDSEGNHKSPYEEALRLYAENQQLKENIQQLEELLHQERYLNAKLSKNPELSKAIPCISDRNLLSQSRTIPARVICREPSYWNSALWIDVGSQPNNTVDSHPISINSPVLFGDSLIGVIDYIEKNRSRVRLITDPTIHPSVRVLRKTGKEPQFLAKGELRGNGSALWRREGATLTGIGFNYDQDDEWGPARDLRTGTSVQESLGTESVSLIKQGDLLVTTGMDGIFPPGLPVAHVSTVYPLKEGSCGYELDAIPTASDIRSLHTVFVIPPVISN